VLYNNSKADITNEVIAALDANYKSSGGTATMPSVGGAPGTTPPSTPVAPTAPAAPKR